MKEIKTTTKYSEENIKNFLEVFYFDRIKYMRIIVNILILIMIIYFFRKNDLNTLDIIVFICLLFGILELNTNMLPKLNYYKLTKKKDNVINSKIDYVFKKNNFKLTSNKTEYIDYDSLKKVIETNSAYYLYINSSRALILDKENLNDEEKNTLTELFKEKIATYKYKK